MSDTQTEMTLDEWVGRLPDFHCAVRQYKQLKEELKRERECVDCVESLEFDEEFPATRISKASKRARQTQAQRKIQLD